MSADSPAPVLTDEQVTLRALRASDLQHLVDQGSDALTTEWTDVPLPYGSNEARDLIARANAGWADESAWTFAVESGGRYCGTVALTDICSGRAGITYVAHPEARGEGLIEPALRLLIEWGFAGRGLRTITWHARVGNWASRKIAWRLGFSIVGPIRESHLIRGELVDAWIGTLRSSDDRAPASRWFVPEDLQTSDVRLRAPRVGDLPRIVEACSDERTTQWLGRMPKPYSDKEALAWLEQNTEEQAAGDAVTWAAIDEDDQLLVAINLFDIGEVSAEVGYWAHPDARGRGVSTGATRAVTAWGFDQLGLRVIQAHAAVDNTASRYVLEAAGFEIGGTVPWGTRTADGDVDAVVYYLKAPASRTDA